VSGARGTIDLSRCEACLARFLPTDGPCPRCGSAKVAALSVPGVGKVLAATELHVTPPGVRSPHRLALVEVVEAVRLLAVVEGALPTRGTLVAIVKDGPVYRALAGPPPVA
jgi:uncharacterized OB-fold protein